MEEQAQKRSTDCLYFLASPLTCKKGSECEYRHSDNARVNPRDCWYWLSGSCRNPNCAFRHPPLEGFYGATADSFYTPSFSALPTSKLNALCYFYFNGICAKREQCPYLHSIFAAQKPSRVVPEASANNPLENKISSCETETASMELLANPAAESLGLIKTNGNQEVSQQAVPSCAQEESSPLAESIVPECEEPTDNFPSVELMGHNGLLCSYQISEELAKEFIEQELDERRESSPGFDVLVDGGSEQLAYVDDVDYQFAQNEESELHHGHVLEYDIDGSACYDHIGYPDGSYLYQGLHEKYDDADYFQHSSHLPREEIIFEPVHWHHRKQKLLGRVHELHARDESVDLHEHLKHRRMDVCGLPLYSRKRRRSHAYARSQERPTRCGINGSVHCRLASQVGRRMIHSLRSEDEYTCKDHDSHGWQGRFGISKFSRFRLRERERRRHRNPCISAEVRHFSALDAEESAKTACNGFAGPKTLAQIKEEKIKSKANFMNSQDFLPLLQRQKSTVDFEGPKPLEELLKDKRRPEEPQVNMWTKLEHVDVSCQVKSSENNSEINDWHHKATAGKQKREFPNGYQDDESVGGGSSNDDDRGVFQAKLAHKLSH